MPLYNYKCFNCGTMNEEIRKVDDRRDDGTCSQCGGKTVLAVSAPQDHRHKGDPRAMTNAQLKREGR